MLIRERRSISRLRGPLSYKALCKEIQKLTRKRVRLSKCAKIKRILDDFRGLKNLPRIKTDGKSWGILRLLDADGHYATDKQAIANAFASFYEEH